MRTAILHIGTEKTGTTTIQSFLARNDGWLRRQGFAYPLAGGDWNGHLLALYARGPNRHDEMHRRLGLDSTESRTAFRVGFVDRFTRQMAALPAQVHKVLFSSEHLHSRVVAQDEIRCVLELLRPHFERIRVLVYLRRQDQVAVSLHSTAMRSGLSHDKVLRDVGTVDHYFDYDRLLSRWAEVFGADAIQPRLLARERLVEGDLLADFAAACGLVDLAGAEPAERRNELLQAVAQEFLRHASRHLPPMIDGKPNPAWDAMVKLLGAQFIGRGRMPRRDEAIRFQASFAESNERVRSRWFPRLPELFDDDFSMYPEQEAPPPEFDDAVAVGALLWRHATAEIAVRDGRIARLTGEPAEAKRQFQLARTLRPRHTRSADRVAKVAGWIRRLAKRWRNSSLVRRLGLS